MQELNQPRSTKLRAKSSIRPETIRRLYDDIGALQDQSAFLAASLSSLDSYIKNIEADHRKRYADILDRLEQIHNIVKPK